MFSIPLLRAKRVFDVSRQAEAEAEARRSNRRRLTVFLVVFAVTLVPGLAWNLLRPGEYRANARVQITAGTVSARAEPAAPALAAAEPPAQKIDLLTQAQILTSRTLLEEVVRRLVKEGQALASAGADPIAELQNSVRAMPVPGTDIVELEAVGASPERLARIVNTLIDSYRDQLFSSHGSASLGAVGNLRGEVENLGTIIANKRAQLAGFRLRSGVVSSERSENEALARIKGLSESLNKANEEAAKAESRLHTLRESAASGKSPVLARDNPTLASIEQRISATREQLRDMERTYTPEFMAMDPVARASRARLAELEQQLSRNRLSSQQAALAAAEEDVAGARATVERLRGQIEAQRRVAQAFSGSFHEAQALEDDLARLEAARRSASERLAKLEASESSRLPTLTLIEAASVPGKPWRPDYLRDGLLNLVASFLLGLLAIWFIELFNRSPAPAPAMPTAVVVPQPWMSPDMAMAAPRSMPELGHDPADPAVALLSGGATLPRELTQEEVRSLLAGADGDGRLLCTVLLLGLTVDELRELTIGDVDLATLQLKVRGASERSLPLPAWLASPLARYSGEDPDKPLFGNSLGQPPNASDINARITCCALDAGLQAAATVSPEVLRHTFIANLMRQNVRFSELAALVGKLGSDELAAYAATSQGPRRVRAAELDLIMPALREPGIA